MEQHVSRMRPVGQPQQDVPAQEKQDWHIAKCQNTGTPHEVSHELLVTVCVPLIYLLRPRCLVADRKEDDVQDDYDCDVKALADRGDVAQQEGKRTVMIGPNDAGVEPGLDSFQRPGREGEVSQPCQYNRQTEGSQVNRKSSWIDN